MTLTHQIAPRRRRRVFVALSLRLALAIAFGLHARVLFAQGSYAPGVEGQVWQQLPTVGRGVDMGNERPITTVANFSDPETYVATIDPALGHVIGANVWPCTADSLGFPALCYPSGTIGVPPSIDSLSVAQNYGGRFAPCVGNQCYASGLIGVGPATTWAFGPCAMQSGASGTDCYPSGTLGLGLRVPPANGQLAAPLGIAVDNTPNDGTIYVTDHWNHRVQAFLFDGSVVPLTHPIGDGASGTGPFEPFMIGSQTFSGEHLSSPESIKVDASRHLLVADSGNGRVALFDTDRTLQTDGNLIDELVVFDPNPVPDENGTLVPFKASPTGVALTPGASFRGSANPPGARLIVTDKYNCTVYFFDATTLAPAGLINGFNCTDQGQSSAFESLWAVEGATIDNAGHAYVADYDRNRFEIFDTASATLIGAFGDPLDGSVSPFALNGPTDVMVDHSGVFADTNGHPVARVFVVDASNQRIAVYKVDFVQPAAPAATFLFELNAAGDLNGYPSNIAEDISRDPTGKLVTTDSGNARIQRFQVPDLAVVNVAPGPGRVYFDVLVPLGKELDVTVVTPIVCPTSAGTDVISGSAAPQPAHDGRAACTAARSLMPTDLIHPGDSVTYSFDFTTTGNTATFDIFANGNPSGGVPQTTSNIASTSVTTTCPTCTIAPTVVVHPLETIEDLTPPVPPSTLYTGARTYTSQVSIRLLATSALGLQDIRYRFTSGPETANNGPNGFQMKLVSGTSATFDVPFLLSGTSTVEFWATNAGGTEIAHAQAQLTLELNPPALTFRFDRATSSNAVHENAAGWWNSTVTLPLDFTGNITAVTSLSAGMPTSQPLSSPLHFTTSGRNLGFSVTVTNTFGLSTTSSSTDPANEGQPINIDLVAPSFKASPAITLERASYAGAPPLAGNAATVLALVSTDPALADGSAGSGLLSVAPSAVVTNFPFGTTTQSFIVTDVAGNTRTGNVRVNVVDTVFPVLTAPTSITVNPGPIGTLVNLPGFSVSDASMIGAPTGVTPVTVTQSVPITRILAVNTTTSVTLTATDPSNHAVSKTVSVIAKLLTPPHFTHVPANQSVEGGAAIDLLATAVDAVGTSLTVTSNAPAKFPLGSTTVTFTAKDASNQTITASVIITVTDTTAPVITKCAAPATVFVAAGAAGAYPAMTGLTATDYSTFTVTQSPAAGSSYTLPAGQTSQTVNVTMTATDGSPAHNASACTATVTFSTASAPVCSAAAANPSTLWPPNHKLSTIGLKGITNADGKPVTTKVTGVFQDEPTQGLGDGDTPIDAYISKGVAQVRAERSGDGNGRVYYVSFTATSASGGSCTGTVTVAVPHDQAHAAVGDGPRFDSTKASTAQGDNCHGESNHGHHDGDGCINGHHGHFDGDDCDGRGGFHHDGDGHGGGRDGGSHRRDNDNDRDRGRDRS